eukprot:CAMPEP_0173213804 /NCGR_PEP_ID=MMETSP1141-20130122/25605_1 /TAXON_ID=483371 /ORGANISM="non described non described, Strain CCMP2298" /LENGTH=718 /DNA_ID=CAMNT_0014141067 /DNA_START=61 /DNA_END=2213 /DNA_ORIENTATION=-
MSFLRYDDVLFSGVRSQTDNMYLESVRELIRAEFNAFLRQAQPLPIKLVEGPMKFRPARTGRAREEQRTLTAFWKEGGNEEELSSLNKHLLVYGGYFYRVETSYSQIILVGPGDEYDGTLPRARDNQDMPVKFSEGHGGSDAYDLGYIGDALSEYRSCSNMLKLPPDQRPDLLTSIADPTRRRRVKYCSDAINKSVPLNEVQLAALKGMKYDVEGIQGPPGTGKSTIIYHIVNSFLGRNAVSLASCVQNKAVDAIAEKLASANNMGRRRHRREARQRQQHGPSTPSPRSSPAPTTWAVDAIAEKLASANNMGRRRHRREARQRQQHGPSTPSPRSSPAPTTWAVDAIAEKLASANNMGFFVVGNEERLGLLAKRWTLDAQVDRHPWVVQAKSLYQMKREEHATRVKLVVARHCTHPHTTMEDARDLAAADATVKKLAGELKMLQAGLREHKQAARGEILVRARVLLCTVATAAGSLLRNAELQPFVDRISAVILDEAGTTPESKMPLLLSLPSINRIIAVGDEKQLQPFTYIKPRKNNQTRTGHCSKGRACRFKHERVGATAGVCAEPVGYFQRLQSALPPGAIPTLIHQYRMHENLCAYVSDSFYGGRLCTPPDTAAARRAVDAHGMYWVSYPNTPAEVTPKGSTSYHNPTEAELVLRLVRPYLGKKYTMVITLYKAQETLIRALLLQHGILEDADPKTGLRICSVDQSQGSEADVV